MQAAVTCMERSAELRKDCRLAEIFRSPFQHVTGKDGVAKKPQVCLRRKLYQSGSNSIGSSILSSRNS